MRAFSSRVAAAFLSGDRLAAPTLKPTNLRLHRGEKEHAGNTCDERSIHRRTAHTHTHVFTQLVHAGHSAKRRRVLPFSGYPAVGLAVGRHGVDGSKVFRLLDFRRGEEQGGLGHFFQTNELIIIAAGFILFPEGGGVALLLGCGGGGGSAEKRKVIEVIDDCRWGREGVRVKEKRAGKHYRDANRNPQCVRLFRALRGRCECDRV